MALEVVVHIVAGELVSTVQAAVVDVNAGLGADIGGPSLAARVGKGIPWAKVGGKLAGLAADLPGMAGKLIKGSIPGLLMMAGEWLLEGVLGKLGTKEGAGLQANLEALGDVLLEFMLEVITPLLPIMAAVLKAIPPVAVALLALVRELWPVIGPALYLQWTWLMLWLEVQVKIWQGLLRLAGFVLDTWTKVSTALLRIGNAIGDAVAGLGKWAGDTLADILNLILGPVKAFLDGVSDAWDTFLDSYNAWMRGTNTYWANGRAWPVGTGPYPGALPGWSTADIYVAHPPDRDIVEAVDQWVRQNGGQAALRRQLRRAD